MKDIETRIGYTFKDKELLKLALTHPSISGKGNNQRLEFLGDSVLGLLVTELLYHMYPNENEGELSRRLSALVRGEALVRVANQLQLGDALSMAGGEVSTGGRTKSSNLEDAMEALIGAIYMDGELASAKQFVDAHWQSLAKEISAPPKDAKSALQEWAQGRGLKNPHYEAIEQTGPAHAPVFTVRVTVEGVEPTTGTAPTMRQAERLAAERMLGTIGGS